VNRIFAVVMALAVVATPALAQDAAAPASAPVAMTATKGKMLLAADGARIAPVSRVASDGPQVIVDGRMVTVPANTIAVVDGKLKTSLTRAQVIALP
jgi:hypothetical protein